MMAELIRNDVLKKKPMNFCLNFLLIRPKSTGWQIHGHGLLVYNTHIKKPGRDITAAASYIFVLSIIPTQ
jgi:hypothetical protein